MICDLAGRMHAFAPPSLHSFLPQRSECAAELEGRGPTGGKVKWGIFTADVTCREANLGGMANGMDGAKLLEYYCGHGTPLEMQP